MARPASAFPVLHLPGVFPHAASLLAHEPPHPIFLQDFEPKESDLWGSRGVALAGLCMLFMAINNFRGTLVGGRVGARLGGCACERRLLLAEAVARRGCGCWSASAPSTSTALLILCACLHAPQASIVGKARSKEKAIARITALRAK